ncbi:MAG: hypothetical protein AAB400_02585 [Patescibacteria group bacterium]
MAQGVAVQDQEMAMQQAQFQQMQQQQSMSAKLALLSRKRRLAQRLLAEARFRRDRASEHDDTYFQFLFSFVSVVDGADLFDGIIGFIIMLFTGWVPGLIIALFVWGPRNYVWKGDTNSILLRIAQFVIKLTPWGRALPANSFNVMVHWIASIEHKEKDLIMAHLYERKAKRILKRKH